MAGYGRRPGQAIKLDVYYGQGGPLRSGCALLYQFVTVRQLYVISDMALTTKLVSNIQEWTLGGTYKIQKNGQRHYLDSTFS